MVSLLLSPLLCACQQSANTARSRGYEHDSCGLCKQCLTGQEIYCAERAMYASADLDQGSFASHAVWREAFLFKLPDELSDEAAAPLYVPPPPPQLNKKREDVLTVSQDVRRCHRLVCSDLL